MADVPHPGLLLGRWLKVNGESQMWLATQLGVSQKHMSRIATGTALYSVELAMKLAKITGDDAGFWVTKRSEYEMRSR